MVYLMTLIVAELMTLLMNNGLERMRGAGSSHSSKFCLDICWEELGGKEYETRKALRRDNRAEI
jgi:hypothetical protein